MHVRPSAQMRSTTRSTQSHSKRPGAGSTRYQGMPQRSAVGAGRRRAGRGPRASTGSAGSARTRRDAAGRARSWAMNVSSMPTANRNGASGRQRRSRVPRRHPVSRPPVRRTIVHDVGASASVNAASSTSTRRVPGGPRTRSGWPALLSASGSSSQSWSALDEPQRPADRAVTISTSSGASSERLTRIAVSVSGLVVERRHGVERRHVAVARGARAPASRRARAARHRGRGGPSPRTGRRSTVAMPTPPGSVRIGAMTLTSWAWQAMCTRSAVAQQADEQPADDDGVDDGVVVLDQRRRTVDSAAHPRRRSAAGTRRSTRRTTATAAAASAGGRPRRRRVATTLLDHVIHVDRRGQEAGAVVAVLLVVGVQRDVVDDVVAVLEHRRLPRPERRHRRSWSCRRRRARSRGRRGASPGRPRRRGARTRAAVLWPICHGPSISLPRHHSRTP